MSGLLAEYGDVGRHLREELAAHRRHAAEEVRAGLTLQALGGSGRNDAGGEALGIHQGAVRRPHEVAADRGELGKVAGFVARIAFEVLVRGELSGVDEDRHHGAPAARLRQPHQLQVALMQRPHGGHQGNALAGPAPGPHFCPQRRQAALHRYGTAHGLCSRCAMP
jgi:hypothetical protein